MRATREHQGTAPLPHLRRAAAAGRKGRTEAGATAGPAAGQTGARATSKKDTIGQSLMGKGFPVVLFLLAFMPRAIRPVSRPLVWYLRSAYFIEDVLTGDWAATVYSEHPGVTLMWPSGIGLKLYWLLSDVQPAAQTVPPDFEPIHFFGPVPLNEITAAVAPLALLIAAGVVAAYLLLRRLFNEPTAVVGGLLLALSPYYIAQSKILHLDATMATLMLLSALAMLAYRRERHWTWLVVSGGLGGLALLTKIPAVFLVPFFGLVLLIDWAIQAHRGIRDLIFNVAGPLAIWLVVAGTVYVAAWPVMWVAPGRGIAAVRWGLTRHATTAHDSPTLFLGEVVRDDPGPLFYLVSLLFRTSEIELLFLVVGAVIGLGALLNSRSGADESEATRRRTLTDLLLLLAFAFFYLGQMSLGAKKMPRYILPALLPLTILAAAGIVGWANVLAGRRRLVHLALMALPVAVHGAVSLPRHPYYGTALNWLAGGPPAAADALLIGEEGEGYAELANYLNASPSAEKLTTAAQLKHVFNQTFDGTTVDIGKGAALPSGSADYVAFHRNYTSRNYKAEEWGRVWERYAAREPAREVAFDGVPYAWLYAKLGPGASPKRRAEVWFGEQFGLVGYDLGGAKAAPGDEVPVVLYWEATEVVTEDLSIFLHLTGPDGRLVWQDDGAANHGERPTWSWTPGETVADPHTVVLPADLPKGEYTLTAGLYDWRTGERLAIQNAGETGNEDTYVVASLQVSPREADPRAQGARVLGLLVVFSAVAGALRAKQFRSPSRRRSG